MEEGVGLQRALPVKRLTSSTKPISPERYTSSIGRITLDEKQTGERSAGNPHATFDAAGAETQLTIRLVRHSQRKRGATDRSDLRSMASALDPTCQMLGGKFPRASQTAPLLDPTRHIRV